MKIQSLPKLESPLGQAPSDPLTQAADQEASPGAGLTLFETMWNNALAQTPVPQGGQASTAPAHAQAAEKSIDNPLQSKSNAPLEDKKKAATPLANPAADVSNLRLPLNKEDGKTANPKAKSSKASPLRKSAGAASGQVNAEENRVRQNHGEARVRSVQVQKGSKRPLPATPPEESVSSNPKPEQTGLQSDPVALVSALQMPSEVNTSSPFTEITRDAESTLTSLVVEQSRPPSVTLDPVRQSSESPGRNSGVTKVVDHSKPSKFSSAPESGKATDDASEIPSGKNTGMAAGDRMIEPLPPKGKGVASQTQLTERKEEAPEIRTPANKTARPAQRGSNVEQNATAAKADSVENLEGRSVASENLTLQDPREPRFSSDSTEKVTLVANGAAPLISANDSTENSVQVVDVVKPSLDAEPQSIDTTRFNEPALGNSSTGTRPLSEGKMESREGTASRGAFESEFVPKSAEGQVTEVHVREATQTRSGRKTVQDGESSGAAFGDIVKTAPEVQSGNELQVGSSISATLITGRPEIQREKSSIERMAAKPLSNERSAPLKPEENSGKPALFAHQTPQETKDQNVDDFSNGNPPVVVEESVGRSPETVSTSAIEPSIAFNVEQSEPVELNRPATELAKPLPPEEQSFLTSPSENQGAPIVLNGDLVPPASLTSRELTAREGGVRGSQELSDHDPVLAFKSEPDGEFAVTGSIELPLVDTASDSSEPVESSRATPVESNVDDSHSLADKSSERVSFLESFNVSNPVVPLIDRANQAFSRPTASAFASRTGEASMKAIQSDDFLQASISKNSAQSADHSKILPDQAAPSNKPADNRFLNSVLPSSPANPSGGIQGPEPVIDGSNQLRANQGAAWHPLDTEFSAAQGVNNDRAASAIEAGGSLSVRRAISRDPLNIEKPSIVARHEDPPANKDSFRVPLAESRERIDSKDVPDPEHREVVEVRMESNRTIEELPNTSASAPSHQSSSQPPFGQRLEQNLNNTQPRDSQRPQIATSSHRRPVESGVQSHDPALEISGSATSAADFRGPSGANGRPLETQGRQESTIDRREENSQGRLQPAVDMGNMGGQSSDQRDDSKRPQSSEFTRNSDEMGREKQPETAAGAVEPAVHGTSAAKTHTQMKYTANRSEIAALDEQQMPSRSIGTASGEGLMSRRPVEAVRGSKFTKETDSSTMPLGLVGNDPKVVPQAVGFDEAKLSRSPVSTHDRLFNLVQSEVDLINSTKADRLSVVLKPDADTEILLRLRMQNGMVEAHARCDRGNFDSLNSHWGKLQESLSACGVQLAPLTTPVGSGYEWQNDSHKGFDSSTSFQNPKHSANHQSPASQETTNFKPTKSEPERTKVRRNSDRLLELWA